MAYLAMEYIAPYLSSALNECWMNEVIQEYICPQDRMDSVLTKLTILKMFLSRNECLIV